MTETTLDQFLRACGATGPLRLGLEGPDAPGLERRSLPQPFIVIGRDTDVDLRLDHPDVSRRHAYLQLINGQLFCTDLQSRTGTRWPDGPRSMGWIRPGQALGIGPYWIWFDGEDRVSVPTEDETPPRLESTVEISLEITGPGTTRATWRLRRAIVLLGRSRPCWVRLPSREVSRIHCSLIRTETGFWAVDLLGRGGITVQGRPTRWARLDPDDELGIGLYRVRVRTRSERNGASWPLALASERLESRSVTAREPAPARPVLATRIEPVDSALIPLFQEIGLMQQQMADQFQQALMMMFQLFSSMHQDEMKLIREELTEIRRLTQEQQRLQAELTRPTDLRREEVTNGPVISSAPSSEASNAPSSFTSPAAAAPSDATRLGPPDGLSRTAKPVAPTTDFGREDLHALLTQRLAAIQEERQTRWQRLVQSLLGKDPTRATP